MPFVSHRYTAVSVARQCSLQVTVLHSHHGTAFQTTLHPIKMLKRQVQLSILSDKVCLVLPMFSTLLMHGQSAASGRWVGLALRGELGNELVTHWWISVLLRIIILLATWGQNGRGRKKRQRRGDRDRDRGKRKIEWKNKVRGKGGIVEWMPELHDSKE